jgi:hypothetical protein
LTYGRFFDFDLAVRGDFVPFDFESINIPLFGWGKMPAERI